MIHMCLLMDLLRFTPSSLQEHVSNKDTRKNSSKNIFRAEKAVTDSSKIDVYKARKSLRF